MGGFAQHDRRADDILVRGDRGLDLAEFDTVPADLDLVVDAPVALDTSVGQPPADVAGAIDARFAGERMLDEFRGGDVGPLVVAAREAGAGEADFPGTPSGTGRSASSSMYTRVSAMGRPISTVDGASSTRSTMQPTVASVGPYSL